MGRLKNLWKLTLGWSGKKSSIALDSSTTKSSSERVYHKKKKNKKLRACKEHIPLLLKIHHRLPSAHGIKSKFSPVQLLSRVRYFATPWTAARQASPSIINSLSLLKPMSID